jgi:voltage-gated potassium channel
MKQASAFQRRTLDVVLFLLTIASLAVVFWEEVPDWFQMTVLLSFVALFAVRWHIAESRRTYIRQNWFDLVFVVLLASPALRLLTALRFIRILPALKFGLMLRDNRKRILRLILLSRDSFPVAMAIVFGMVFIFGSCVFLLERGENPSFGSIHDGLWWAFVSLTTVGYGDIVPITDAGRIVAVILIVFGVAVYSLLIANLTHYLNGIDRDFNNHPDPAAIKEPVTVSDSDTSSTRIKD